MSFDYEVLIIGGGPAGLSAALSLGRLARTALLCDDQQPRNAPSSHVNNFPSRDGVHPAEWRNFARKDLEKYQTIEFFDGQVVSVDKSGSGFTAKLANNGTVSVRKVILAYGVKDRFPPIPGFMELWGKSIFHCPFCHGFEIRGSRLGFLISNEMAFHPLPMIRSLSSDLIMFTNGKMELNAEQRSQVQQMNIELVEDQIERFDHEGETLRSISFSNGKQIERQYLFFNPEMPFSLKSQIGTSLGCEKNELGFYQVNELGATTTPGVYAAGDNMSPGHSVLLASASGARAGVSVIAELLKEDYH